MSRFLVASAVFAALLLHHSQARADCATGQGYGIQAEGNTVLVCITGDQGAQTVTLLRQDVSSSAMVQVSSTCAVAGQFAQSGPFAAAFVDGGLTDVRVEYDCCVQDACVPPGSYRYGLATPPACPNGCSNQVTYWVEATVASGATSDPDGGCGAATSPYTNKAPWPSGGDGIEKCGGCGGCSEAASVLGIDSLLFGGAALALRRRRR